VSIDILCRYSLAGTKDLWGLGRKAEGYGFIDLAPYFGTLEKIDKKIR
jgi:hypothetical protein